MPISINGTGTITGVSDFSSSNIELNDPEINGGIYLGGTGSANYLDDYETGTWTPTFEGNTTAGSYSVVNNTCRYVKVGSLVHVFGSLVDITEISSGSGGMILTGLPFTSIGGSAYGRRAFGTARIRQMSSTFPTIPNVAISASASFLLIVYYDQNDTEFASLGTFFNDGMDIGFSITYYTAD